MKISTMRQVDRWMGVPACAVLTLFRRVLGRTHRGVPEVRRILFVKLAEQGSTVLASQAFAEAIRRVGPENVYFLALSENRFIMDAMALIPRENVITFTSRNLFVSVWELLGALKRLRAAKPDAAIDLEFFVRSSAVMCLLSGARTRVGYHASFGESAYRGDLMTHRVLFNPYWHTSRAFAMLVRALDVPPEQLPAFDTPPPASEVELPRFRPGSGEADEVRGILARLGVPSGARLVLLNANCSDMLPLRKWPQERYAGLAKRLAEEVPNVCLLLTGAPDEAEPVEALARSINHPRCISVAGKTTLRQLLVLFGLADVLVTNDSGPAHFAAITEIDVVSLFGPETPELFAPQTPRSHVLWAGIACSPCVSAFNDRQSTCKNNLCMQRITVDQVFAKVVHALDRRAAARTDAAQPAATNA